MPIDAAVVVERRNAFIDRDVSSERYDFYVTGRRSTGRSTPFSATVFCRRRTSAEVVVVVTTRKDRRNAS